VTSAQSTSKGPRSEVLEALAAAAASSSEKQPPALKFLSMQLAQLTADFADAPDLVTGIFKPAPSHDAHQMALLLQAVVAGAPPSIAAAWAAQRQKDIRKYSDQELARTLGNDPCPRQKLDVLIVEHLRKLPDSDNKTQVLLFACGPLHSAELAAKLPPGVEVHEADIVQYHKDTKLCNGVNPVDESNSYSVAAGSHFLDAPCEHIHKVVMDMLPALTEGAMVCFAEHAGCRKIEIAHQLLLLLEVRGILADVQTETDTVRNVRTVSAVTTRAVTSVLLASLRLPDIPITHSFPIEGAEGEIFSVLSHSTSDSVRCGASSIYLIETKLDVGPTSDPAAEDAGLGFLENAPAEQAFDVLQEACAYLGSSRDIHMRLIESMKAQAKRICPTDSKRRDDLLWKTYDLLSFTAISDRNLEILRDANMLTVDFVELFLRYFETLIIQAILAMLAAAEWPVMLTNKLPYGYTVGDLHGGYFMNSGFGNPLQESVAAVKASNLSPWAQKQVIVNLRNQAIVSGQFDVSTHEAKGKMIDADKNLTATDRERKHDGLENAAIASGQFAVSTHEAKGKKIDEQKNLTVADKERKHQDLKNVRTLHGATKHKAKQLAAEAVSINDQRVAASALAMVKRTITGGASELSLLEDALDALRAGWPGWGVITQAEGKQWPETEPQEHDSVLSFIRWRQDVGYSNVSKRVKYGKTVKDQERRRLVTNFDDKRKAYSTAVSRRDVAVRDAKKHRLADEERSEL
jgi:hypothetical protein